MGRRSSAGTLSQYIPVAVHFGLASLILLVYLQTRQFAFVNYDDGSYVFENAIIRSGLSFHGLVWAFSHIHSQNWHPLTSLSHMLDCQLFGLHPGAHHLVNVLLHIGAASCLFEFLRRTTRALWPSAAVAAIFAVHPLRVESVAWVSERKDVLSGLFFMLTLLSYSRYAREPGWRRMFLVALTFAAGLMSKPMLVTMPVLLLLLDYWPLDRNRPFSILVAEKIPLFLLSAASCFATMTAQRLALGTTQNLPLEWRLTNAVASYFTYFRQLVWPRDLIPFYVHPEGRLTATVVVALLVVILAITVGALLLRRCQPYLFVGWLWYLLMLLPVIGLIQVGLQGHADRYTYLPSIGIIIGVVWGVNDLTARWSARQFILGPLAVAVIILLAMLSYRQAIHWRDTESLWSYTLSISPDNDVAHAGLAGIQLVRGDLQNATDHYRRALELRYGNSAAHFGLALALAKQRKLDQAITHWEKGLEIQPDNTSARNYLGTALASVGREREAVTQWRQTLDYDPENGDAANDIAWVLTISRDPDLHDPQKGVEYAERATRLPGGDNAIVYRTLGAALAEDGQFERAIAAAEHARSLATAAKNSVLADEMARTIALFQQGKTLRQARETR